MPTYDYQCGACDHLFELFQNISDPVKRKCPECGRLKLRRLFGTGAAILFKGSGFYETDYRRSSEKGDSEKGDSETPKTKDSSTEGGAGKDTASSSSKS